MKTYKDVIFLIVIVLWLGVGISTAILYPHNTHITNLLCLSAFGILVLFKVLNRKFGFWLETPLKSKKEQK